MTKAEIKESLLEQLDLQNKTAKFYEDMINDYLYYWDLKKKLIKDIKDKGLRYKTVNGNGIMTDKANESVVNLQKTTATMLKILNDLNLREPFQRVDEVDGYM